MAIQHQTVQLAKAYHPGETLSEKLEEMGMSVKEFAIRTSKPEKTIIAVIKGVSAITTDMAITFENVTQIPAHFWINKQRLFDEQQSRKKRETIISQSVAWMQRFPIVEMTKLGWIPSFATEEERVDGLFRFFGISTEKAWHDYYLHQRLKIAFRISLSATQKPEAISAWLRKGELQAAELYTTETYTAKRLKANLPRMKQLMIEEPTDLFLQLQKLCAQSGIKIVYTHCLPNAPIKGATRWINDMPMIQLSDKTTRYDQFWFNFFHEVGHLLLHGKKDIFLEESGCMQQNQEKELEADTFAINTLISRDNEKLILNQHYRSFEEIKDVAVQLHTHPALIVGRLLHHQKLSEAIALSWIPNVEL